MRLILGAGCAGLSLAVALVEAGIEEPLVLVDRRTAYEHDRTWCFWLDGRDPLPLGGIHHAWHRWRTIGRDGRVHEQRSDEHPYVQVRGDAFYAAALARLEAAPQVELRLGERVLAVEAPEAAGVRRGAGEASSSGARGERVRVRTAGGTIDADHVYDAMGGAGPLQAGRPHGSIELRQSFLGLEIEAARPVFDPSVATLMDFRTGPHDDGAVHFMYLLPTSPTRALVEHTTLGPSVVPSAVRRAAITRYLEEHAGLAAAIPYEVIREERGVLPMTTRRFPLSHGPRIDVVGAAAGAVRPSSGYAFVRIARHAAAVARAAAAGAAPPRRLGPAKNDVLDGLFLRALAVDPASFDRTLLALAARTSGDTFARFMSDRGTARDDATVMAALAGPGFLWPMAASSLLRPITRN